MVTNAACCGGRRWRPGQKHFNSLDRGRKPRPRGSRRPPRRRYQYGAEAERRARDQLRRLGYHVTRSAQSRGGADLVAVGPRDLLLVQCKAGELPAPGEIAKGLADLADIPTPEGATVRREVWCWEAGRQTWHRHREARDG